MSYVLWMSRVSAVCTVFVGRILRHFFFIFSVICLRFFLLVFFFFFFILYHLCSFHFVTFRFFSVHFCNNFMRINHAIIKFWLLFTLATQKHSSLSLSRLIRSYRKSLMLLMMMFYCYFNLTCVTKVWSKKK